MALEWDELAEERHRQISSGDDISFDYVVVPTIWQLFEGSDPTVVLDLGSGTGHFTVQLARFAGEVIAVEPSRASMSLARVVCQTAQNVRFVEASIEQAAEIIEAGQVTAAVAVMSLMTAPDLHGVAKALAAVLKNRGPVCSRGHTSLLLAAVLGIRRGGLVPLQSRDVHRSTFRNNETPLTNKDNAYTSAIREICCCICRGGFPAGCTCGTDARARGAGSLCRAMAVPAFLGAEMEEGLLNTIGEL